MKILGGLRITPPFRKPNQEVFLKDICYAQGGELIPLSFLRFIEKKKINMVRRDDGSVAEDT